MPVLRNKTGTISTPNGEGYPQTYSFMSVDVWPQNITNNILTVYLRVTHRALYFHSPEMKFSCEEECSTESHTEYERAGHIII